MKRKDKILLLVLSFFLVVALIIVLGVLPTRDKIKDIKEKNLVLEADVNKLDKDNKTNYKIYKNKKEEYDEILKNANAIKLDKYKYTKKDGKTEKSDDIYPNINEEDALRIINKITLKYGLPISITDNKHFVSSREGGISILKINLPDGAKDNPVGYFMGYTLVKPKATETENMAIYNALITKTNKLNGIEEYLDSNKIYYALNDEDFHKLKIVAENRIGGVDYILRKLTKEINESHPQIKVDSIRIGDIIEEKTDNTPSPGANAGGAGGAANPTPNTAAQKKYYVTNDFANNTNKVELKAQYIRGLSIEIKFLSIK